MGRHSVHGRRRRARSRRRVAAAAEVAVAGVLAVALAPSPAHHAPKAHVVRWYPKSDGLPAAPLLTHGMAAPLEHASPLSVTYYSLYDSGSLFESKLDVINRSDLPVSSWRLVFGYAATRIVDVQEPDAVVTAGGLIAVDGANLAPHADAAVIFLGVGRNGRPNGCTINGSACFTPLVGSAALG